MTPEIFGLGVLVFFIGFIVGAFGTDQMRSILPSWYTHRERMLRLRYGLPMDEPGRKDEQAN